jgi:hypothetical protein
MPSRCPMRVSWSFDSAESVSPGVLPSFGRRPAPTDHRRPRRRAGREDLILIGRIAPAPTAKPGTGDDGARPSEPRAELARRSYGPQYVERSSSPFEQSAFPLHTRVLWIRVPSLHTMGAGSGDPKHSLNILASRS